VLLFAPAHLARLYPALSTHFYPGTGKSNCSSLGRSLNYRSWEHLEACSHAPHLTERNVVKPASIFTLCGLLAQLTLSALHGDEPLHVRIDQMIAAKAGDTPLARQSGDAEFLRRVYLDLAGRIPTVDEARQFLSDSSPDRREQLIDGLLAGPEYPRRMQELFHAMLMERRGDNEHWTKFLRSAFEENMPWDQMARAIIKADAADEKLRGAAYFLTARLVSEGAMAPVDVPGLTRDVGRLLAGVDLGCAQCHDHISIDQYKQRDFQGLHMVFENVQSRRDVQFPAVAEKVMTAKKDFMSVFEMEAMQTPPRIPGGKEIEILAFAKGEEYAVPPDRKTRSPGEPKFSPLGELATGLTSAENELFCKNIANRLWFVMMGRGLVEPLDLHHNANPSTHPKLLDMLTREFAAHKFDIKWMLRELALTQTYQRTSDIDPDRAASRPAKFYTSANEKRLSAEQLFWSIAVATGELERANKETTPTSFEEIVVKSKELDALRGLFLKAFANPPKEPEVDFEPTVKAALFLMHGQRVLDLLKPRTGNLVERLSKLAGEPEIAEELFLAIFSRLPTDEDQAEVTAYLKQHKGEKADALGHLAWALLSSTEFCVNH
jgi:hypothetical protein